MRNRANCCLALFVAVTRSWELTNNYTLGRPCPCVKCTNCGAESAGHDRIKPEVAIAAWNTRTPSPSDHIEDKLEKVGEALDKIRAAQVIVSELCSGSRRWAMSVPARPDSDPDLVIAGALAAAKKILLAIPAGVAGVDAKDAKRSINQGNGGARD